MAQDILITPKLAIPTIEYTGSGAGAATVTQKVLSDSVLEFESDGTSILKLDPTSNSVSAGLMKASTFEGSFSGDGSQITNLTASTIDHGALAGKADDDHTQYVIKTNTTQARNTIQPNGDVPALTLQAGLSNTSRLFEVKDSLTQTKLYIDIDGNLASEGSKSFLIDHPTKEGMKLQYTCLEGPENGVYVRGRCTDGVIELPDYWIGLVHADSISVNLSPVGQAQADLFISSIADNKVFLQREANGPIDCFYTVYGVRKDIDELVVEFPA